MSLRSRGQAHVGSCLPPALGNPGIAVEGWKIKACYRISEANHLPNHILGQERNQAGQTTHSLDKRHLYLPSTLTATVVLK